MTTEQLLSRLREASYRASLAEYDDTLSGSERVATANAELREALRAGSAAGIPEAALVKALRDGKGAL